MRNMRKKWTSEEDQALLSGVKEFGFQWSRIRDKYKEELKDRLTGTALRDRAVNLRIIGLRTGALAAELGVGIPGKCRSGSVEIGVIAGSEVWETEPGKGVIYVIEVCDEGGVRPLYVGQTRNAMGLRMSQHKSSEKESSGALYEYLRAWRDKDFGYKILEVVPEELLDEKETYWINELGSRNTLLNRKDRGIVAAVGSMQ